jgi:hypothetical protein
MNRIILISILLFSFSSLFCQPTQTKVDKLKMIDDDIYKHLLINSNQSVHIVNSFKEFFIETDKLSGFLKHPKINNRFIVSHEK